MHIYAYIGEVASPCGFDLHFHNEYWCGTSLHVLIGHLCIFFGEMSIQVLFKFFLKIY